VALQPVAQHGGIGFRVAGHERGAKAGAEGGGA
jgi:hypothetical protein